MAKNKGSRSAAEQTSEAASTTSTNGAPLFEVMEDGFEIPSKLGASLWDERVKQVLATEKGDSGKFPVCCIFSKEVAAGEESQKQLMEVYTRGKQLKQAAKRLQADITVAVRKLAKLGPGGNPIHAVLAQRNK